MSSQFVPFPVAPRTVLIVDDQPSVLAALSFVFTRAGYSVVLASKGAEALALAENQSFHAALVDLHMPGMDGITLCRSLAERWRTQNCTTPIWIMTAAHTKEMATKSVEAGARALLKKPFDTDELMRQIDAVRANSPPSATPVEPPPTASFQAVA